MPHAILPIVKLADRIVNKLARKVTADEFELVNYNRVASRRTGIKYLLFYVGNYWSTMVRLLGWNFQLDEGLGQISQSDTCTAT